MDTATYEAGVPVRGRPGEIPPWSPDTGWRAPLEAVVALARRELERGTPDPEALRALTRVLCQAGDRAACAEIAPLADGSALACRSAPGLGCVQAGDPAALARGCVAEADRRDGAACETLWRAGGPHAEWYRRAACLASTGRSEAACRAGCKAGDGAACVGLAAIEGGDRALRRACGLRAYSACLRLALSGEPERLTRLCAGGPDVPPEVVGRACQAAANRASSDKERRQWLERACIGGGLSCGGWLTATRSGQAPTEDTRQVGALLCPLMGGGHCTVWGEALEDERAGPPDPFGALAAYDRACTDGHAAGCDALGRLRLTGPSELQDPLAGLEQLRRGCTLGSSAACVRFGVFLEARRPAAPEILEAYQAGCRVDAPLPCLLALTAAETPREPASRALAARLAGPGGACQGRTAAGCLAHLEPAVSRANAARDPNAVQTRWKALCAEGVVPAGSCR